MKNFEDSIKKAVQVAIQSEINDYKNQERLAKIRISDYLASVIHQFCTNSKTFDRLSPDKQQAAIAQLIKKNLIDGKTKAPN